MSLASFRALVIPWKDHKKFMSKLSLFRTGALEMWLRLTRSIATTCVCNVRSHRGMRNVAFIDSLTKCRVRKVREAHRVRKKQYKKH